MKKLVVSFLLVATVALAACGSNAGSTTSNTKTSGGEVQSSLTVKDSNGEKIEVKQKPQKVVVFDNGSLDTLDALGVGDKVVGAATKNLPDYLAKYKEVDSAGGLKEPDLEKINQM